MQYLGDDIRKSVQNCIDLSRIEDFSENNQFEQEQVANFFATKSTVQQIAHLNLKHQIFL